MKNLEETPELSACSHFELNRPAFDIPISFVSEFLSFTSISGERKKDLERAARELLQEIYDNAYRKAKGEVTFICSFYPKKKITIQTVDHGLPFNPIAYKNPLVVDGDCVVSGEGSDTCLKTLNFDEVAYKRENEANILSVTKYI